MGNLASIYFIVGEAMNKKEFLKLLDENNKAIYDWLEKANRLGISEMADLERIWDSRDKLVAFYTGRDKKGRFVKTGEK